VALVLTITCNESKIRAALVQVAAQCSQFRVDDTMEYIDAIATGDMGYMTPSLLSAATAAADSHAQKLDNQSDLVRALRMPAGSAKDLAVNKVVDRCRRIFVVCSAPSYKHPMRCCCCGRCTELDLETGVRVLQSSGMPHYICEHLLSFVQEQEKEDRYPMFAALKKVLIELHIELLT